MFKKNNTKNIYNLQFAKIKPNTYWYLNNVQHIYIKLGMAGKVNKTTMLSKKTMTGKLIQIDQQSLLIVVVYHFIDAWFAMIF